MTHVTARHKQCDDSRDIAAMLFSLCLIAVVPKRSAGMLMMSDDIGQLPEAVRVWDRFS